MFKFNKRQFSLLESPAKFKAISPSPSLNSPFKRSKLNLSCQLSSTLLKENLLDESINDVSMTPIKNISSVIETTVITDKKEASDQANIETPPPTPEINNESRIEVLTKQKANLINELEEAKAYYNTKFQELSAIRKKRAAIRGKSLRFEDMMAIVNRSQNMVRDQLNEIYHRGNELAAKTESFAEQLHAKHIRKFSNLELELKCYLEKSQRAIEEKANNLYHEIELHQRTLLTKRTEAEMSAQPDPDHDTNKEVSDGVKADVMDVQDDEAPVMINGNCNQETETGENVDDDGGVNDLVAEVISLNGSEESNVASRDGNNSKHDNNVDDEETDIDVSNDDESRPFTPCQAQRPE